MHLHDQTTKILFANEVIVTTDNLTADSRLHESPVQN